MDLNYTPAIVSDYTESGTSKLEKEILMDNLTAEALIPLRHSSWAIVILLIAYLTVLVVGLMGNVLVIFIVVQIPKMKTATKFFIRNLAIADLLVLLFCLLPNLISSIYVPWVMGSFMCKTVPYVQGVSVCASVYSLAAISADRLIAIGCPLRRQITKVIARRIIALIWIWAAGLALPWLLYFDLSNADQKHPSLVFCVESWPPGMNGNTYFVLGNLGLCYLVPLGFISFCHLRIWLSVRHPQVPTDASASHRQFVHKRAKASVQKMVIVVVVGFAASWLPLYAICVRIKLIPVALGPTEEQVLEYALPIAQWLGAANSCVNPIFYVFCNGNFRCALRRLLPGSYTTPKKCPNPHLNNHPSHGPGIRRSLVSLLKVRRRSHRKYNQHKNFCHISCDFNQSHQKNPKFSTITRSQSYQEAMENPW